MIDTLENMARQISEALNASWYWVAYTGGVPGIQIKLPADRYADAAAWLVKQYGQPQVKAPWHPDHTKGIPPLCFTTNKHGVGDHVNLISMKQQTRKRYVLITVC